MPELNAATNDRISLIRKCYLFSDAHEESLRQLAAGSSIETFKKRSQIFADGDVSDGLRIVVSGLVKIWISDEEGRELTLALIEAGEGFGEIALLDRSTRTANATVIEPTETLLLRQSIFDAVLEEDPTLARHLIILLCDRLRRNVEDIRGFAFQDLGIRLANKLCELAMAHADLDGDTARFTRKFSQTDLANMLGATREAVNKRLSVLCNDDIVKVEAGWITIRDLPTLQSLADQPC